MALYLDVVLPRDLGDRKAPGDSRRACVSGLQTSSSQTACGHGQGDLAGESILVPVGAVQLAQGGRLGTRNFWMMGQRPRSWWDSQAGNTEPKLPWDAKAVPAEVTDGAFLVLVGKQQVGEAVRLAESS